MGSVPPSLLEEVEADQSTGEVQERLLEVAPGGRLRGTFGVAR